MAKKMEAHDKKVAEKREALAKKMASVKAFAPESIKVSVSNSTSANP
ncbi:hypothetical protein QVH35_08425 [Candidatus Nitrosotenuis chungbukensis]|nr:hypothetical protein [Candidatus Nitrosotenuis chungbukensis]WKT57415.1 hypothetical protein QVH35_08425 [Candidatus Nitrosotenuis chungbukensis]